jgi:glutaredoxin
MFLPEICVYGVDDCEDTQRTRRHLGELGIAFTYINLDKDTDADRKVREWNSGWRLTPTVVIAGRGRTKRLVEPKNGELDDALIEQGYEPAA